VRNSGCWRAEQGDDGTRTGIENVRKRLAQRYPGTHEFKVVEEDGFVITRIAIASPAAP
jgi:two-component system LytT family sensor kinase